MNAGGGGGRDDEGDFDFYTNGIRPSLPPTTLHDNNNTFLKRTWNRQHELILGNTVVAERVHSKQLFVGSNSINTQHNRELGGGDSKQKT
jgi:hypothetical protein